MTDAEAATVERHLGKGVMSQVHGVFSIGMALSLAAGAPASHAGVAPLFGSQRLARRRAERAALDADEAGTGCAGYIGDDSPDDRNRWPLALRWSP